MGFWQWCLDLITNRFILTGAAAWLIAQVVKTIIHAIINRRIVFERLIGDGGMPSAHSATVSSLAIFTTLSCGTGLFQFAACAILAIIVCHDAMGVRLETGKQAQVINEMMKSFSILTAKELPQVKLKEFVGHTLVQVMAGILIGIVNALIMYYLVFLKLNFLKEVSPCPSKKSVSTPPTEETRSRPGAIPRSRSPVPSFS